MCGRFALYRDAERLRRQFAVSGEVSWSPRYNIAPGSPILGVFFDGAVRRWGEFLWGFIPHWAKAPRQGAPLINARAESVIEKPTFREALQKRRLLVPADAFYEWKPGAAGKQPYALRPTDPETTWAFAGLWDLWQGPEGPLWTACILTTAAPPRVAPLHERMPVILPPEGQAAWLDPASSLAALQAWFDPAPEMPLWVYPVSRRVNGVRADDAGLLEPVGA